MNAQERVIPSPVPTEDTKPFWEAAAEGRFLIKRCLACEQAHWYPRALCPFCFSERTEWQPASGGGVIYSYTVMRRATPAYVVAFVTLDEGPTMLTNIVACDPGSLAIGQKVRVVFRPTDGPLLVPVFQPAEAG